MGITSSEIVKALFRLDNFHIKFGLINHGAHAKVDQCTDLMTGKPDLFDQSWSESQTQAGPGVPCGRSKLAFAAVRRGRAEARRVRSSRIVRDQARENQPMKGSFMRITSSRSGLVETSATGVSMSSAIRFTYLTASAGRSLQERAPTVDPFHPCMVS